MLWDTSTWRLLHTLEGDHDLAIRDLAFSADGRQLASGDSAGALIIWDVATGRALRVIHRYGFMDDEQASKWAINPAAWVAAEVRDNRRSREACKFKVKLWDLSAGRVLREITVEGCGVESLCFNRDGSLLATGNSGKEVTIWDVSTGRKVVVLSGNSPEAYALAFSSNGRHLLVHENKGGFGFWDVSTGTKVRTDAGPSFSVLSISMSADGRLIAYGAGQQYVGINDAASGHELRRLSGFTHGITGLAFSPDTRWLVTAGDEHVVKVWEVSSLVESVTPK